MRRLLALSVLFSAASMGCRICSSPYDYCGPVVESGCVEPNGRGGCYGSGGCTGGGCGCNSGGEVSEGPMNGVPVEAAPMNGSHMNGVPMNGTPMNGQSFENSPEMNSPATMSPGGAMPDGTSQAMPTAAGNQSMGYNPSAWRQSNTPMQYR